MKQEVYKTSDQGLAAYLMLLNYICIGAIPTDDPKRMDFVFLDVDNPGLIAQEYLENRAVGKLLTFRKNLMTLRRFLRDNVLTDKDIEEMKRG